MATEKEVIFKLIEQLNKGLEDGTVTPEQEEKIRDDISGLQMNVNIGDLFED